MSVIPQMNSVKPVSKKMNVLSKFIKNAIGFAAAFALANAASAATGKPEKENLKFGFSQ